MLGIGQAKSKTAKSVLEIVQILMKVILDQLQRNFLKSLFDLLSWCILLEHLSWSLVVETLSDLSYK